MAMRKEVLGLYRRILRLARTWESADKEATSTGQERDYIRGEARRLFTQNKHETDENEIQGFVKEGETRLEMAIHYQNPYPRIVHLPQHVLHSLPAKRLKTQKKKLEQSKPIYIKSIDDNT